MKKLTICAIVVFVSCTALQERVAIKECRFRLVSVTAYDFTFSNMKLNFNIRVDNPNSIDAVLDKLAYTFYVNDIDVFSGTTGKIINIPAERSTEFSTTITLEYTQIGQALAEAMKLKQAAYRMEARAYVSTILGEMSYPVNIAL